LNTLFDKIDQRIKESNSGSAEGWIKQSFINLFVSLKDIKKGIPEYADAILHKMTKTQSQLEIKTVIKKRLDEYLNQTFELQDKTALKRILLQHNSKTIEEARSKLKNIIEAKESLIWNETLIIIILGVFLFLIHGLKLTKLLPYQYYALLLMLIILITAGVSTPMIDMEAKISQMRFVLLDHIVEFNNQFLYFQSKSILDVFWIMITDKAIQMKLVGCLMITFSILFPLLKLISSMGYYYNYRGARKNSWIQFFVLKTGKWSMADVLVVSIFMAFIGFNGIITSQFGQLDSASQELVILTTNGTSLQPGFYLFLTYAILAMVLTSFISKDQAKDPSLEKLI
jgi:hypothetical protein